MSMVEPSITNNQEHNDKPVIAILAGGTGGHIFPGLAIAKSLQDMGADIFWLGGTRGLEVKIVPNNDIPHVFMEVNSLRGKGLKGWLVLPFSLIGQVLTAKKILKKHRVTAGISMGGYVAGPGGLACKLAGIPLFVHEQNSVPGLTNKVLAFFAKKIFTGFPGIFVRYKAMYTGNPVRKEILRNDKSKESLQALNSRPIRLLVLGGSQGAFSLNNIIPEAIALIEEGQRPEIIHQCGARHLKTAQSTYEKAGVKARVIDFIENMGEQYNWADLVICRSGALTVAELAASGVASILIPFPAAVDDHQTKNARFLSDKHAAVLISESDLNPRVLSEQIIALFNEPALLDTMADNAYACKKSDAAQTVATLIMEDMQYAA